MSNFRACLLLLLLPLINLLGCNSGDLPDTRIKKDPVAKTEQGAATFYTFLTTTSVNSVNPNDHDLNLTLGLYKAPLKQTDTAKGAYTKTENLIIRIIPSTKGQDLVSLKIESSHSETTSEINIAETTSASTDIILEIGTLKIYLAKDESDPNKISLLIRLLPVANSDKDIITTSFENRLLVNFQKNKELYSCLSTLQAKNLSTESSTWNLKEQFNSDLYTLLFKAQ